MAALQNTNNGRERLRGEGDEIKYIDLRCERGLAVGFAKGRRQA